MIRIGESMMTMVVRWWWVVFVIGMLTYVCGWFR